MTAPGPRLPTGYRALLLDEIHSTNQLALERARDGEPSGLWIVAGRQTAGRGRQGRVWASEPGNLFASLMLRDPAEPARLGELPLVVALAVHDAVADVLPPTARSGLEIKWPNDVLLAGAKIAGILIEGTVGREGRAVVIGVGVNCASHPDGTPYPATDLAAAGHPTDPVALFERLAARLATRLAEWQGGSFAPLRDAWLARARGVGGPITVRLPDRTVSGRFEGLDAGGRLLLRAEGGVTEAISAGDVFFG
jgi:BirA family biotin operon repressor/biotin-[acetyl-CoA-carboxylase] ligase